MDNKRNLPQKNITDVSELNLRGLLVEARDILTAPKPILFKKFGNRRLEEDVKRIGLINEYINNLISSGESLVRLNVDSITSMEKIQLLAETELNRLRLEKKKSGNDLEIEDLNYEYNVKKLRNSLSTLSHEFEVQKLELEKQTFELEKQQEEHKMSMKEREQAISEREKNLELKEKEAEQRIKESDQQIKENELDSQNRTNISDTLIYIQRLKARDESKFNKSFITLYNKLSRELKLENITPSQTLILISLFSKNPATSFEDVDIKRKFIEEELKKMKQDTAYRRAEAKNKRLDNETKIYKIQKEKMDIDE